MTLPTSQPNYFDSSETGAPTLNNVTASLLEVIRACAKNGFNSKTVTSIAVASGVATATAASHGYSATYGKLLLIEGSGEALLNGRKQPLSVATNTFTFAAPGVADGTYTGTMSAKRAPLGWTEPHTGTNVAIFARSAPEATAMLLRVNDSHANGSTVTDARIVMAESATDVDTYSGLAPTAAQVSGGLYWHKGPNSATAKQWCVVGNDRFIWVFTQYGSTVSLLAGQGFGDIVPYYAGDAYGALVAGASSAGSGTSTTGRIGIVDVYGLLSTSYQVSAARAQSGSGTAQPQALVGPRAGGIVGGAGFQTAGSTVVISPSPLHVNDGAAPGIVRGEVPGVRLPMFNAPFTHLVPQTVVTSAGDRVFLPINFGSQGGNGQILIELTSGWYD
ncbi:hypothetical protein ACVC7V_21535 [Hydrogenophaga sp. A37]|uniref:hypothetical protein n=1 Tax=Hydrogenophaga sp. A37 TaxID=1945864 RepID=UPI00098770DF|nr:hypothetical protein [Hydrogenophaga sp. A37]OOG84246.1 hypothetical protein B0E41_10885 [Hydrogenophaga sp. A37]